MLFQFNTHSNHLSIICRCPKITFLDERFFNESDMPYIKKALKTDYIRTWDSSRWSRHSDYGEFQTPSEMKKLTKDYYDNKKKSKKSESRRTGRRTTRTTQTLDKLKPEILLRLSKWLDLQSTLNCLPPDKKDKLNKILSERHCSKDCKECETNICLYDSGDEDSCPFNLIRTILKSDITEKSTFVISTDQTPYFQIQDLLNKL